MGSRVTDGMLLSNGDYEDGTVIVIHAERPDQRQDL